MVRRRFLPPTRWDRDRLAADRQVALDRFLAWRAHTLPSLWAAEVSQAADDVLTALAATGDLLELTGTAVVDRPGLWHLLRYCCAPPVSEENLWTVVGGPKFKDRVPAAWGEAVADAVRVALDPVRFPWVGENRPPTDEERRVGALATAPLIASQRIDTSLRIAHAVRQEGAVAQALAAAGFTHAPERTPIWVIDELARGSFSRERKVAGVKCDVPVRLRDGRILALECKVSNTPKNGWKRLLREVGGKADTWRGHFGDALLVGGVLAGVFDLSCLERGQDMGVALHWEHNLGSLADFVAAAH